MVYAQADSRWAEADLTVISLELLTVFGAAPLALWICYGISKRDYRVAFWMIVLATGELYGGMLACLHSTILLGLCGKMLISLGFMTFAPEWLTGSQNLDTSNFMFLWVYLVFFNVLWVFFPLYALYISFIDIGNAMKVRNNFYKASAASAKDTESKRK